MPKGLRLTFLLLAASVLPQRAHAIGATWPLSDTPRFWILGEGEQHLGAEVVSFQSAVGRALMNHAVGDEVVLGEGDDQARWRIVSIERQLPRVEDAETPSN